jgi:hypothetical protein
MIGIDGISIGPEVREHEARDAELTLGHAMDDPRNGDLRRPRLAGRVAFAIAGQLLLID